MNGLTYLPLPASWSTHYARGTMAFPQQFTPSYLPRTSVLAGTCASFLPLLRVSPEPLGCHHGSQRSLTLPWSPDPHPLQWTHAQFKIPSWYVCFGSWLLSPL